MRHTLSLLALSLLLLSLAGCARRESPSPPPKPAVPEFQTFTSPQGDFEVRYATKAWEAEQDTTVALSLKHKTEPATIQLIATDLGQEVKKSDLRMFSGLTIASVKESFKGFKEAGKGDTTFAGVPAHQYAFTCTEQDTVMTMRMIFFASGTKAYALIVGGEAERFGAVATEVDDLLAAFRLSAAEPKKPVN
jgi:hypothetical protein